MNTVRAPSISPAGTEAVIGNEISALSTNCDDECPFRSIAYIHDPRPDRSVCPPGGEGDKAVTTDELLRGGCDRHSQTQRQYTKQNRTREACDWSPKRNRSCFRHDRTEVMKTGKTQSYCTCN
ncbi:unnamed protein product [Soboliphyme baturini]|uniref:Thyroglobulin type-1 domain-containing protein n=1 Tax=Soboliphyme baturini TaxID=241478 RepID=A0A183II39_9BILA|nr:unnamed protein product [Soboliphyme baturini]